MNLKRFGKIINYLIKLNAQGFLSIIFKLLKILKIYNCILMRLFNLMGKLRNSHKVKLY